MLDHIASPCGARIFLEETISVEPLQCPSRSLAGESIGFWFVLMSVVVSIDSARVGERLYKVRGYYWG